jgi:hypothetical protein
VALPSLLLTLNTSRTWSTNTTQLPPRKMMTQDVLANQANKQANTMLTALVDRTKEAQAHVLALVPVTPVMVSLVTAVVAQAAVRAKNNTTNNVIRTITSRTIINKTTKKTSSKTMIIKTDSQDLLGVIATRMIMTGTTKVIKTTGITRMTMTTEIPKIIKTVGKTRMITTTEITKIIKAAGKTRMIMMT